MFAATRFTSRTKRLIYGYKFYERRQNLRQMETLLTHYWIGRLAKQFSDFDRICWIPLPPHAGKDSHLLPLAKRMASRIPDSTVSPLLAWRWETKFQHHLKDKQSRIDNLTDCFKLDIKALQEWERKNNGNGRVLWVILDDIVTTGTTMRQAVKALQEGLRLQSGEVSGQIMGLSLTQVPLTSQSLLAESFQ